jgi:hypothetical protein
VDAFRNGLIFGYQPITILTPQLTRWDHPDDLYEVCARVRLKQHRVCLSFWLCKSRLPYQPLCNSIFIGSGMSKYVKRMIAKWALVDQILAAFSDVKRLVC